VLLFSYPLILSSAFLSFAKPSAVTNNEFRSFDFRFFSIIAQDGRRTFFKVRKSTKFRKLFQAFEGVSKVPNPEDLGFYFHGQRIVPHHTPGHLGIEDGDKIDCY